MSYTIERFRETGIPILTQDDLAENPWHNGIIASGVNLIPVVDNAKPVAWVAKRGDGFHDWCIYYGPAHWLQHQVATMGNKIRTEAVVRYLVPCHDDAYKLYRK